MTYTYADYSSASLRLADASRLLLASLRDPHVNQNDALSELESATDPAPAGDLVLGFEPRAAERTGASPEVEADTALSALLLEFQSANVLISSGVALGEHGSASDQAFLLNAIQEIDGTSSLAASQLTNRMALRFEGTAGTSSATLADAKEAFRGAAFSALDTIVDESAKVASAVLDELKKLEPAKILAAIDNLGNSIQVVAGAGRLIRKGIEKLKGALDALGKLFGAEILARAKEKVAKIWEDFQKGDYSRALLSRMFSIEGSKSRVQTAIGESGVTTNAFDIATNAIGDLIKRFASNATLLRNLVKTVTLLGTTLAFFHLAAPWLPLALGAAYVLLVSAAVLVGMDYCDSGTVLGWVHGIGEIAGEIRPADSDRR